MAAQIEMAGFPAEVLRRAETLLRMGNAREAHAVLDSLPDFDAAEDTCLRVAQLSFAAQRPADALRWTAKAIEANPVRPEHHYTLARLLSANEDDAAAETSLRTALSLLPDYVDAWVSLGNLLRKHGRFEEAEASHREALRLDPTNYMAAVGLGNSLLDQGNRLDEAVTTLRQAVELNPDSAAAQNSLGKALEKCGNWREAGGCYLRAVEIDPSYPQAAEGLGKCLVQGGHYEEAIETLQEASRKRPESYECRFVLGIAYIGARRVAAAIDEYQRLIRDHPRFAPAKGGLACALSLLGQFNKPRALFEEAVRLSEDTWIRWWYSHMLLRNGAFAEGWRYYGVRESLDDIEVMQRACPQPLWRGESLAGRTLLVTCEQGLGDEIMFASVFPEIAAEAGHCILECDTCLVPLFRRSFPQATVVGVHRKGKPLLKGQRLWFQQPQESSESPVTFDYWIPAGSIPMFRRPTRESFPDHRGYLHADPARIEAWRTRLDSLGPGLKIGLSWRGGVVRTDLVGRSLTTRQLVPLLQTRGAHFICLQYDDCAAELDELARTSGVRIHHWPDAIRDYDETAALVSALDLSISVTTAAVHLAGALGKPAWVMVPHVPEWRYGNEGTTMVWYPSVRLFRQNKSGALGPALNDVQRALRKLLSEKDPIAALASRTSA